MSSLIPLSVTNQEHSMMKALLRNLEVAKDFLQTAVDTTVSTVESAHSAIANAAFNVAEQATGGNEKLQQLKKSMMPPPGRCIRRFAMSIRRSVNSRATCSRRQKTVLMRPKPWQRMRSVGTPDVFLVQLDVTFSAPPNLPAGLDSGFGASVTPCNPA